MEVETWHFRDGSGVPPAFVMLNIAGIKDEIYWTLDGPDMKGFKLGFLRENST